MSSEVNIGLVTDLWQTQISKYKQYIIVTNSLWRPIKKHHNQTNEAKNSYLCSGF